MAILLRRLFFRKWKVKQFSFTSQPKEYSSNGFLIMDWPKMYWKKLYPSDQWTEIEEVLNQEQKNSKNQPPTKNTLIILGVIGLIIGIVILLVLLVKRKKVRNKIN